MTNVVVDVWKGMSEGVQRGRRFTVYGANTSRRAMSNVKNSSVKSRLSSIPRVDSSPKLSKINKLHNGPKTSAARNVGNFLGEGTRDTLKNMKKGENFGTAFSNAHKTNGKLDMKKAAGTYKKEIDKIRRYTGTEGGTLTDFFKGSRGNFLNVGMSVVGAVSEFKEGRNAGKTILGSATDATLSFAVTEMLGMRATIGLMAAKGITNLAAIGTKYALNSSRSMNNIQRFSPFADAQFQDTQQLATMRQSGMELAKMSQYNLQQTR